jgi:hypothetical protein
MKAATETLEEVMHRVRGQRSSLIVTVLNGHLALRPVDDLPEEEQRRLWREFGEFWIAGAPLEVNEAWHVTPWPDDDAARSLSALLLVPVNAHVSRPLRRQNRPAQPQGPLWN